MVDYSVTPANVIAGSNASRVSGSAGETIAAGKAVVLSPTTKKWMLADSNSATAALRVAQGVALNGAALDQPLQVATRGDVTVGAVLTANVAVYLSDTPGGLCPVADVGSGEYPCMMGMAKSTSVLTLNIQAAPGAL